MTATTTEGTELIERIFEEVFNQKRLEVIDELFAQDYVEHHPVMGDLHGREAFKELCRQWFRAFPDMKNTISDIVIDGDLAYWKARFTGTHTGELNGIPPTGKRIDILGINKGIKRNGQAVEHWTGNDFAQMMQQLGLMPEMPG